MLIRISLIIAILAGLGAGAFNFIKVKEKVTLLQQDRDTQKTGRLSAENERDTTKKKLEFTSGQLRTTSNELVKASRDLDRANQEVRSQTQLAGTLRTQLTTATAERNAARQDLAAFKALNMEPEEILVMRNAQKGLLGNIDALKDENKLLGAKLFDVTAQLDRIMHPEKVVFLPAGLSGKVLVADPKWGFVILNVGREQGIMQDGELLVNRNGRLVAKVVVHSIQKDRCVANVMPGWQLGDIFEGDLVIPAHPES
jgi:hypothetical protein